MAKGERVRSAHVAMNHREVGPTQGCKVESCREVGREEG